MVHQMDNALDAAPMPECASIVEARSYILGMITVGIDLASQDIGTAMCELEWSEGRARVMDLRVGVSDAQIAERTGCADKLGIDVPLGWPSAFVDAVTQHAHDGSWPPQYQHSDTLSVRYRRTDLVTWESMRGHPPLSVSTDKIALPAMRAAALLSRLDKSSALDGSGVVVEAYPAVALKRWGFTSRGYKGSAGASARIELVELFARRTADWLVLRKEDVTAFRSSDDAFDSLIAALVARASAMSLVESIDERDRSFALREGWIALPLDGSLRKLAHA